MWKIENLAENPVFCHGANIGHKTISPILVVDATEHFPNTEERIAAARLKPYSRARARRAAEPPQNGKCSDRQDRGTKINDFQLLRANICQKIKISYFSGKSSLVLKWHCIDTTELKRCLFQNILFVLIFLLDFWHKNFGWRTLPVPYIKSSLEFNTSRGVLVWVWQSLTKTLAVCHHHFLFAQKANYVLVV